MSKRLDSILIIFLAVVILPSAISWSIEFTDPTETSGSYINRNYSIANVTSSAPNTTYIYIELFSSGGGHYDGYGIYDSNEAFHQFENIMDGTYYFNATATDNETNTNYTETRNVTIDTTYPAITYVESTDNGTIDRTNLMINVSANDTYLSNISVYIYNSTLDNINYTMTDQDTYLINYSENIVDGEIYYFNATACDMAGNCNSTETWNVTIDTYTNTAPYTNMNMPLNGSYHNTSIITLNATAYDDESDNMTVWIYGDDTLLNTTENVINGTEITFEWDAISEGVHNWTVIANDGAENSTYVYYNFVVDTTPPSIEFILPQPNVTYNITMIIIDINSTGNNTWFFNGTDNQTYEGTPINITFNTENNTLYAYTNDTAGNFNMTEVTFYINMTTDIAGPIITINSPSPQENTVNISLNITLDENGTCVYNIDDASENITMDTSDNISFDAMNNNLTEGNHTVRFYCNDTIGNWNDNSMDFYIDITPPNITFNHPSSDGLTINTSNITFNITVIELNLENLTFNLYNSTGSLVNDTISNTSEITIGISDLSNGIYYYNATAYDTVGNSNSTNVRNITINVTAPIVTPPDDGGDDGGGSHRSRGGGGGTYYLPATNQSSNTSGEDSMKIYWSTLPAGNRIVTNEKRDIPIDSLSILLINRIDDRSGIEIYSRNSNPFDENIRTKIFKYVIINTSIEGAYIEKVEIKFRIDKVWLKENNISMEDVTLYGYDGSKSVWNSANTSKITDDGSYAYYSSTSAQLLSLAIGGKIEQPISELSISNLSNSSNVEKIGGESISLNIGNVGKKSILRSIIDAISGDDGQDENITENSTRYKQSITKDTQFLLIAILSSIMMLAIGTVSGVLIYRNISARREFEEQQAPEHKVKAKKIISYIEEPASTGRIVSTANNTQTESKIKPLPGPELYIRKVDQLLLQCEYALDGGKTEDAKKYYAEAKDIYLHSRLNYEQKSKIYDKIMALSSRVNKR